jgi:DNA-binding beta-propeller fold protein YncE
MTTKIGLVLRMALALFASLAAATALAGCAPATVHPDSAPTQGTSPARFTAAAPGLGTGADGPGSPGSGFGSLGSALVGSAPAGTGPSAVALDPATHTIYVANGYNANGPDAGGDTVSVIDARHCQARDVSRCKGPWPTITVGDLPAGLAVDQKTDTVYVTDSGANTVSVFNGATCNALDASGCGQKPVTVPVGPAPLALFDDPANHTVYIANCGSSCSGSGEAGTVVSMIDSATCNAADLAACPTTSPPAVNVKGAPDHVDVNQATHTVYVTTIGALNGWAVFNANTCNATVQSGCGAIGALHGDPVGPTAGQVDPANDTLYTANYDNTISAFDLRHCNASDLSGCATQTAGTVMPFPPSKVEHTLSLAVDVPLHSVYVTYQRDDALIVVDTNTCNGSHPAGCAKLHPPAARTGAQPEAVTLDEATQTLYTANQTGNNVSVIDASLCNAQITSGCRQAPPTVPISAAGLAADQSVNTVYAATPNANAVAMISTMTCDRHSLAGCASPPPHVAVGTNPVAVAVDPLTHTVYVANYGSMTKHGPGTVSVLGDAACNATNSAGCANVSTLQVPGGNPDTITVNAATDTIYVATTTDKGPNLLSVFNGATCNAATTAGCNQKPATLTLGDSGGAFNSSQLNLAVNQATNTIYATNIAFTGGNFAGDSVYVIDGATCDAANTSRCSHPPATITPGNPSQPGGLTPWGIAVDQATDTIYVALEAQGDYAGSVAVIDGATCNGSDTTGCGQTPPTVAAGFGVDDMAIDPATHEIYTTNTEDASLSVIDGATCNRLATSGCGQVPSTVPAGTYPGFSPGTLTIDTAAGSAYVTSQFGVSVIPLTP